MSINKIQILGIIIIIVGIGFSYVYDIVGMEMLPAILIGIGAGLTVYKRKK
jgi:hypothetical protein